MGGGWRGECDAFMSVVGKGGGTPGGMGRVNSSNSLSAHSCNFRKGTPNYAFASLGLAGLRVYLEGGAGRVLLLPGQGVHQFYTQHTSKGAKALFSQQPYACKLRGGHKLTSSCCSAGGPTTTFNFSPPPLAPAAHTVCCCFVWHNHTCDTPS